MGTYLRNPRRRWCDLPPEILDLVLQRLSIPDRFSFSGVCSSWRSVLLATNLCCHSRPPPLMVLVCNRYSGLLMGLNGSLSPPLKLRSPMPTFLPNDRVVGSSSGWLVIVSYQDYGLRLLNPTSNQQILLPSTASDGTHITTVTPPQKLFNESRLGVRLAVLSSPPTSPDCVLVAGGRIATGHHYQNFRLASCRPGRDREWTTFAGPRSISPRNHMNFQKNHMAFHNGELVLFDICIGQCRILTYNFDPSPILRSYYVVPNPSFMISILFGAWHLVSSGGELLLAVLRVIPRFYKLGAEGWEGLESLGDRVLLIGCHSSVSFCTRDLMGSGFEPNCIYYHTSRREPFDHLIKLSLADGSTKTIPLPLDDYRSQNLLLFDWVVTQA